MAMDGGGGVTLDYRQGSCACKCERFKLALPGIWMAWMGS